MENALKLKISFNKFKYDYINNFVGHKNDNFMF